MARSVPLLITVFTLLAALARPGHASSLAPAEAAARAVYEQTCAACHTPGTAKAPRLGDRARWARLQREGQLHVTAHGWLGEGAMPPKGGRTDLSLQAFADTVAYMARSSGQSWPYADAELIKRLEAKIDAEQRKKRKP